MKCDRSGCKRRKQLLHISCHQWIHGETLEAAKNCQCKRTTKAFWGSCKRSWRLGKHAEDRGVSTVQLWLGTSNRHQNENWRFCWWAIMVYDWWEEIIWVSWITGLSRVKCIIFITNTCWMRQSLHSCVNWTTVMIITTCPQDPESWDANVWLSLLFALLLFLFCLVSLYMLETDTGVCFQTSYVPQADPG